MDPDVSRLGSELAAGEVRGHVAVPISSAIREVTLTAAPRNSTL